MSNLNFRFSFLLSTILLTFISITYVLIASKPSTETGVERARPIIDALEAYKSSRGYYPTKLDTLTSTQFISEIPQLNWKYKYSYEYKNAEKGFILGFSTGGPHYYCYYSLTQKWENHDDVC